MVRRIHFYCESTQISELGTGHYWRSKAISEELSSRGHNASLGVDVPNDIDVLVVDHIYTQRDIILSAKKQGCRVVLIDGHGDDVGIVDESVSGFYNLKSNRLGIDYVAFPKALPEDRYDVLTSSETVFVAMGGYDACSLAELVLPAIYSAGLKALVAKSNNHVGIADRFTDTEVFRGKNYYKAMGRCLFAITAGGLSMFQALHYGMPTIVIPQYEHQLRNIYPVINSCIMSTRVISDIGNHIKHLCESPSSRSTISASAQQQVDGRGVDRIANIIETV